MDRAIQNIERQIKVYILGKRSNLAFGSPIAKKTFFGCSRRALMRAPNVIGDFFSFDIALLRNSITTGAQICQIKKCLGVSSLFPHFSKGSSRYDQNGDGGYTF